MHLRSLLLTLCLAFSAMTFAQSSAQPASQPTAEQRAIIEQKKAEKEAIRQSQEPRSNAVQAPAKVATNTPDRPVFKDTGNPEADNARYAADKADWIAKHPDQYEAAKNEGKKPIEIFSREAFNKFPADRQKEILAHPETFRVAD